MLGNYKKIAIGNTGFTQIAPSNYVNKTIRIPLNLSFYPSKVLFLLSDAWNFYFNYILITPDYVTSEKNFYSYDISGNQVIFKILSYTKESLELTVTYCESSYMHVYFKDWIAIE